VPTIDEQFQLLAAVERRRVLVALRDRPAGETVDPIAGSRRTGGVTATAEHLRPGGVEDSGPEPEPDSETEPLSGSGGATADDVDSYVLALKHHHLPRLDEAGVVDWEPAANTVSRGPRFDEIEPLLELLVTHSDRLPGRLI
jgi:hypothetical protein